MKNNDTSHINKINVKVQFVGWWDGFDWKKYPLFSNDYIASRINFVISKKPDFVIFGCFGNFLEYVSIFSNAVKILICSEPISPDFIFFDYVFGFEKFEFGNRYIYYPACFVDGTIHTKVGIDEAKKCLQEKTKFCDFIYRHETKNKKREHYYKLLNSYKKVDSAGSYLNNQQNNYTVAYDQGDPSKYLFQKQCKFCLCIQETNYPWFLNEKIAHAIIANEIPIFYGTSKVKEVFNKDRFLFIDDFKDDNELLNMIIKIDNDDSLFLKMITTYPFNEEDYQSKVLLNAHQSLFRILSGEPKLVRMTDYAVSTMIKNIEDSYKIVEKYSDLKNGRLFKLLNIVKKKKKKDEQKER